jgi:hypothetical protein
LRISLRPPLSTQNTEAGLASAQALGGAAANMARTTKPIDRRMLLSCVARRFEVTPLPLTCKGSRKRIAPQDRNMLYEFQFIIAGA